MNNQIVELTIDELTNKYCIQNDSEYELLKNGKSFIDSAFKITDSNAKVRVGSALIEYMLYKMNGGK